MRLNRRFAVLAILLVIVLATSFLIVRVTEASIDYWLVTQEKFLPGLNSVSLGCENVGESDGEFKLVLKFTNVLFSNQTEMPYEGFDDSTVKVRFSLHKGELQEKRIYFTIPDNMKSFKIALICEKISLCLRSNPPDSTEFIYSWFNESYGFMRAIPASDN